MGSLVAPCSGPDGDAEGSAEPQPQRLRRDMSCVLAIQQTRDRSSSRFSFALKDDRALGATVDRKMRGVQVE
jgi:hypothetical protein